MLTKIEEVENDLQEKLIAPLPKGST